MAALAWVPWVLRNPWNFEEGFRNPWILNKLSCKYHEKEFESINISKNRWKEEHFHPFQFWDHTHPSPIWRKILWEPMNLKSYRSHCKRSAAFIRESNVIFNFVSLFFGGWRLLWMTLTLTCYDFLCKSRKSWEIELTGKCRIVASLTIAIELLST